MVASGSSSGGAGDGAEADDAERRRAAAAEEYSGDDDGSGSGSGVPGETPYERRVRLAKRYLEQMGADLGATAQAPFDDEEGEAGSWDGDGPRAIDHDAIAHRLTQEVVRLRR